MLPLLVFQEYITAVKETKMLKLCLYEVCLKSNGTVLEAGGG